MCEPRLPQEGFGQHVNLFNSVISIMARQRPEAAISPRVDTYYITAS